MSRATPFMENRFDGRERDDIERLRYGVIRGEVTASLGTQVAAMKRRFPAFVHRWDGSTVVWEGPIHPTPLSKTYTIQVTYSLERPPRVRVLNPELVTRDGGLIPHTYRSGHLCLYFKEFARNRLICATIVPWSSLWFCYYEGWLATGVWKGEGSEPGPDEEP